MPVKKVFFTIVYFIIITFLWLYSSYQYTADKIVTGTKEMYFDFVVTDESVYIAAGSCDGEFAWQNQETGEIFRSQIPTNAGLGTNCKNYYQASQTVGPGYWQKIVGSAEFSVEKDKNITETPTDFEISSVYLVLLILYLISGIFIYFAIVSPITKR